MKSSLLQQFVNYKELQPQDNNVINLYNQEPLNVLMTGIISKIDVKNAGLKQETLINVKQKIFSQDLNQNENEGFNKNVNNYYLRNNLNNISNKFENIEPKRYSAYENFLKRQSTLMKVGRNFVKRKKRSEKKLNTLSKFYNSQNSIRKTVSTHISTHNNLTNILSKKSNKNPFILSVGTLNNKDINKIIKKKKNKKKYTINR